MVFISRVSPILDQQLLTGCDCLESLLHFCDHKFDMRWRASPEDQAVSRVFEARFNRLIFQLCKDSVDGHAWKVRRGELLLLLDTSGATMSFITSLNLSLRLVRHCSRSRVGLFSQHCRGKLRSSHHMDYLTQWVLHQKDLRTCRKQPWSS